jgi:hypothetical protein
VEHWCARHGRELDLGKMRTKDGQIIDEADYNPYHPWER